MKTITVFRRVMVDNRTYQPGPHSEASIPAGDLDVLLKGGFAEISGDGGQSVPANTDMSPKLEGNPGANEGAGNSLADKIDALLSCSVKEIKDALDAVPDAELFDLYNVEALGRNRKGVLEAIEAEIAVRENSGNEGGN